MIDKCQYGYIKDRKKISWLWLAACIVIGVAIFLAGYMLNHNRANVFTVVAILMVLPAAKRVVNLVVLAGKKVCPDSGMTRWSGQQAVVLC